MALIAKPLRRELIYIIVIFLSNEKFIYGIYNVILSQIKLFESQVFIKTSNISKPYNNNKKQNFDLFK